MRLIDAEAFAAELKRKDLDLWLQGWGELRDVERQKTVDAVPVVRCKDCMYCKDNTCYTTLGLFGMVKPWDYCSYGERRTDTGD